MKTNIHQSATGISNEDLFFIQVENAIIYLNEVMGCDAVETDQICKSVIFWKWWVNHWNRRDQEFILMSSNSYAENKRLYLAYHNPISVSVFPHRIIMQEAYATVIMKKEVCNG